MEIDELISGVIIKKMDEALGKRSNVAPRVPFLKASLPEGKDPTNPFFALLDSTGNIPAKSLGNQ